MCKKVIIDFGNGDIAEVCKKSGKVIHPSLGHCPDNCDKRPELFIEIEDFWKEDEKDGERVQTIKQ